MQFESIIGQAKHIAAFKAAYREGRVPHAQLILAPEGAGGLPLAMAMGQYLQCTTPAEDVCGTCPACQKASKMIHPDIHYTFPVIKPEGKNDPPISTDWMATFRKAYLDDPYLSSNDWANAFGSERKSTNITVRECHTIIKQLTLKAYEGHAKIQIIWQPELLGKSGNTLLKLVEEPPPDTYLIFVAEDEDQILGTLLSRCQITRMGALSDDEVVSGISTRFPELTPEAAKRIAYQADGNFNAACKMALNHETAFADALSGWLQPAFKYDMEAVLNWIDQTAAWPREQQKQFFLYAIRYCREILQLQLRSSYQPRVESKQVQGVQWLAGHLEWESIAAMVTLFEQQHYYVGRNAHMKTQLLHASLTLMALLQNQRTSDKQGVLA